MDNSWLHLRTKKKMLIDSERGKSNDATILSPAWEIRVELLVVEITIYKKKTKKKHINTHVAATVASRHTNDQAVAQV